MTNDFLWHIDEFKPGKSCSEPLIGNLTDMQTGYRDRVYPINSSQLDGLELTLSLNLAHFYPAGVRNDSSAQTIIVQVNP